MRDVLNGTLKFSQTICDENEEISINDGYYGNDENQQFDGERMRGSSQISPESDILFGVNSDSNSASASHPKDRRFFYMSSEDTSPDGPESSFTSTTNAKDDSISSRKGSNASRNSDILGGGTSVLRNNSQEKSDGGVYQDPSYLYREKEMMKIGAERNNNEVPPHQQASQQQITSRIRNIFKSSTGSSVTSNNKQERKGASGAVRPLDSKSDGSLKQHHPHLHQQQRDDSSSERVPTRYSKSDSFRNRSKSGDEKYPSLTSDLNDDELLSHRERSKSQPATSLASGGAGGDDNYNPLYSWKYNNSQGMDY